MLTSESGSTSVTIALKRELCSLLRRDSKDSHIAELLFSKYQVDNLALSDTRVV